MRAPRKPTPAPMRRRDVRYMVAVPLLLHVGRNATELITEDVGHGGLFLRVEEELPLNHLVRVEMLLPPHADRFEANGKVVHRVPAAAGDRAPGIGVQFYGLGAEPQRRWDTFVAFVRERFPEASERVARLTPAEKVQPLFWRNQRHTAVFRLHLRALPDLVTMFERDVKRRRLFVLSEVQAYPNDEVGVIVVHPHSGDVFELSARVLRVVRDHGVGGLLLELLDVDADREARFEEFVYDAIAPLFDDEDVER